MTHPRRKKPNYQEPSPILSTISESLAANPSPILTTISESLANLSFFLSDINPHDGAMFKAIKKYFRTFLDHFLAILAQNKHIFESRAKFVEKHILAKKNMFSDFFRLNNVNY